MPAYVPKMFVLAAPGQRVTGVGRQPIEHDRVLAWRGPCGSRPRRSTVEPSFVGLRLCQQARRHPGIAERIAEGLAAAGHEAEARPARAAGDLAGYDAFVIGSASYAFHWRKEASKLVRRNRDVLAGR
jgi:hypothetical protein